MPPRRGTTTIKRLVALLTDTVLMIDRDGKVRWLKRSRKVLKMYNTKLAAAVATEGLSELLIPKSVSLPTEGAAGSEDDSSDSNINDNKNAQSNIFMTTLVCLLAGVGAAASAAAMISIQTAIVLVAGSVCCVNATSLIHRQNKLNGAPGLRNSINQLKDQAKELMAAVDFLRKTIDELHDAVDDAKVVENELRLIVADQGANVTEIVELVRENETILDAMKHNLRESFVAEMARLILRSDTDGDMTVDPQEGELLALRLSIQLKPHGITLDVLQFEQLLKEDNDVGSLLKFCSEVLYPEIALEKSKKQTAPLMGEEESDISEEDDFFAPSPSKENALPDFAFFCKKLSMLSEDDLIDECDNVKMTVEDKLSIFSIDSKYSGGSVEVARGRKMSIFPGSQLKKESRASQMVVEAKKISAAAIDRRKTRGMAEF